MANTQRLLNILWILIVCVALITANWFQIFKHLKPCTFCLFQRVALLGIGMSAMMNLRFGIKIEHYALGIVFATLGMLFSYRLSPFGGVVFGYHLSSWAAMVFVGSIIGASILLRLYSRTKVQDFTPHYGKVEKGIFALLSFLVLVDIITVLQV